MTKVKVKDFAQLFIGNDNEQIMLCNWRSNWTETITVNDLISGDWETVRESYMDGWEYVGKIICIYYFV